MGVRYRWTQPLCYRCWNVRNPEHPAFAMAEGIAIEVCVDCGEKTQDGIYIRVNPRDAKFPTLMKGDSPDPEK